MMTRGGGGRQILRKQRVPKKLGGGGLRVLPHMRDDWVNVSLSSLSTPLCPLALRGGGGLRANGAAMKVGKVRPYQST